MNEMNERWQMFFAELGIFAVFSLILIGIYSFTGFSIWFVLVWLGGGAFLGIPWVAIYGPRFLLTHGVFGPIMPLIFMSIVFRESDNS